MQQYQEFGRYYEDGQPSRTRRPRDGGRRRSQSSAARTSSAPPRAGLPWLRREIRQAVGSRSALRRSILLAEILGPPKALQPAAGAASRFGTGEQQPSRTAESAHQNGRQQYADSASPPHLNGHAELPAGRPPTDAGSSAADAGPASERTGRPRAVPEDAERPTPALPALSRQGPASRLLAASFRAVQGWLRRAGVSP